MSSTYGSTVVNGDTIHWRELPKQEIGVSYNDPSSRREWLFDGSLDRDSILTAVAAVIPAIDTCAGVARFFDRYDCKEAGGGSWIVSVSYRKNPTYWELSIDASGGTSKMFQSFKTVRAYLCANVGTAQPPEDLISLGLVTNFKKAIGVNGTNVEGVDQVIPKFDFSINYKFKMSTLSASYLMTLYAMQGAANNAPYTLTWKGQSLTFATGDLRFMGSMARQTSDDDLDLTFRFSAIKGLAGGAITAGNLSQPAVGATSSVSVVAIGDLVIGQYVYIAGGETNTLDGGYYLIQNIVGTLLTLERLANPTGVSTVADSGVVLAGALISADPNDYFPLAIGASPPFKKKGWEYLWVHYVEETDPSTGLLRKVADYAYVEQVVRYRNFADLGIS